MKYSFFLVIVFLSGCSSIHIEALPEDNFSISHYKTFKFADFVAKNEAPSANYRNNVLLLREAITKQMAIKGVDLATENPDLLVNIGIIISVDTLKKDSRSATMFMGDNSYSNASQATLKTAKDGTVILHFIDRAEHKLVWQGAAESVMPDRDEDIPALIEKGAEKLFKKVK